TAPTPYSFCRARVNRTAVGTIVATGGVMRLASIVIGMIVLLGGCARARVSPPGQDVTLVGTSWTVERIEELVADRASTTVRFEEGRVSGRAGCNQYSGYLQAAGNALRVS